MNSIDKLCLQETTGLYVGDDLFENHFHDHVHKKLFINLAGPVTIICSP